MKRARAWLEAHDVPYTFVDYKKVGAPEDRVRAWIEREGWEAVINRRGTTWRKLPESARNGMNADRAVRAAIENPSLIRRPIVEDGKGVTIGFDETEWRRRFA